jgi:hypothetical protein
LTAREMRRGPLEALMKLKAQAESLAGQPAAGARL